MDDIRIIMIASCFHFIAEGAYVDYTRGAVELDDVIRPDGSDFAVRSLLGCSIKCAEDDLCSGFSHSQSLRKCQLHTNTIPAGSYESLSTMKFYIRESASVSVVEETTSIAPVATDVPIDCPVAGSFTSVVFDDGAVGDVLFRTVVDTYQISALFCDHAGGSVAMIESIDQQTILSYILTSCPDFAGISYWIDGHNNTGTWEYGDGRMMPSDDTYLWVTGSPRVSGSGTTEHCVIMSQKHGFRWDNAGCTENHGIVCTKEVVATSDLLGTGGSVGDQTFG